MRREPAWDVEQRALAYALLEHEDGLCPGCHTPLEETTAPDAEDAYADDGPVRCHKCAAMGQAKKKWREEPEDRLDGLLFSVRRRPPIPE